MPVDISIEPFRGDLEALQKMDISALSSPLFPLFPVFKHVLLDL